MTSSNLLMHTSCSINRQLVYQFILMTCCILSTRLATLTEQGQMKSKLCHTNRGESSALNAIYNMGTWLAYSRNFTPEHYDSIPKTQYFLA